jgi:hypothetical protein
MAAPHSADGRCGRAGEKDRLSEDAFPLERNLTLAPRG